MIEVTFGAVLSVLLGAVLAAGYLIAQPVETVRSLPKEPDSDAVYYVKGSAKSAMGRQWLRKKQMLVEGGAVEIELSEDELNTWMSSSEMKPDAEEVTGFVTAKGINFRVNEGIMQIGLPCALSLPGFARDVVVQAKGGFEKGNDGYAFVPQSLMIGKLAMDRVPVVGGFVAKRLMAAQEVPEDLQASWRTLNNVRVDGNSLMLVRR
ncbi:MAG: hypothetical protein J6386_22190 [Candidatus Synoicihabitans palmerolidicus]|nr:hypothetical protein [Candidatus Synoicihabitans palmerolidicus]